MFNIINKLERKSLFEAWQSRIKLILYRYYQYSRIIKGDRRWLLMFVIARFPWGRATGTLFYSNGIRLGKETSQKIVSKIDYGNSTFEEVDVELVTKSIDRDGYFLGLKLPQSMVGEILEFAYSTDINADGNPDWKFKYSNREQAASKYNIDILVGNYATEDLQKCTAFNNLTKDSKLSAIAAKYLNSKPVLVRSQMNWNFVGDKAAYYRKGDIGTPTVLFHYDLDDYRAIKFFFYLTDVDSLSGSHRCVAGSHRRRKLVHCILRGQSDRKIEQYYGAENIIEICGSAGFGFAEDPFCFHRGSPPVTSPRLIIQLEFALNDYLLWN